MKSLKNVLIRTACLLLFAALSNSFTLTQTQQQTAAFIPGESSGSIRFIHAEGDMLVFELHLINLPASGSTLRIFDGDNNTLHEQQIKSEVYNIRYKIARGEISKINFEVSGKKMILNQAFNIKARVEEKIEVTGA